MNDDARRRYGLAAYLTFVSLMEILVILLDIHIR